MKPVKASAPASIANLTVGFDSLGIAIRSDERHLSDIVKVTEGGEHQFIATGGFADCLPNIEKNLVVLARELFYREYQQKLNNILATKVCIELEKELPVCSGLGSSSSSIVATLIALNTFFEYPFEQNELLLMSAELEHMVSGGRHLDNVAPSLIGGMQLVTKSHAQPCVTLPVPQDVFFTIIYPDFPISTAEARQCLPKTVSLSQAVLMQQRLARFVSDCYNKPTNGVFAELVDDIVEPQRIESIENFYNAKQAALRSGCTAFGVSGSGPTCFAVANEIGIARQTAELALDILAKGSRAFACVASIDHNGARVI